MFLSSPPPPSLAWGFYNSLRRKSVASCKEPQVRNSTPLHPPSPPPVLPRRPTLICSLARMLQHDCCMLLQLPPPPSSFISSPGLPSFFLFLFSLHGHTWAIQLFFYLIPAGFGACAINLKSYAMILSFPTLFFFFFFWLNLAHSTPNSLLSKHRLMYFAVFWTATCLIPVFLYAAGLAL